MKRIFLLLTIALSLAAVQPAEACHGGRIARGAFRGGRAVLKFVKNRTPILRRL